MSGLDGIGLSYTAVTPRASLQSDANKEHNDDWVCHISNIIIDASIKVSFMDRSKMTNNLHH